MTNVVGSIDVHAFGADIITTTRDIVTLAPLSDHSQEAANIAHKMATSMRSIAGQPYDVRDEVYNPFGYKVTSSHPDYIAEQFKTPFAYTLEMVPPSPNLPGTSGNGMYITNHYAPIVGQEAYTAFKTLAFDLMKTEFFAKRQQNVSCTILYDAYVAQTCCKNLTTPCLTIKKQYQNKGCCTTGHPPLPVVVIGAATAMGVIPSPPPLPPLPPWPPNPPPAAKRFGDGNWGNVRPLTVRQLSIEDLNLTAYNENGKVVAEKSFHFIEYYDDGLPIGGFNMYKQLRMNEYNMNWLVRRPFPPFDLEVVILQNTGCSAANYDVDKVKGRAVFIQRGDCLFGLKWKLAWEAGAKLVVCYDTTSIIPIYSFTGDYQLPLTCAPFLMMAAQLIQPLQDAISTGASVRLTTFNHTYFEVGIKCPLFQ